MKNSFLNSVFFFAILIFGVTAGGLLSCGKKELPAVGKEVYPKQVSINGELWWKSGFWWEYVPQNGSVDSEKIGCFVPEENKKQQMKTAKSIWRTTNSQSNSKKIEIYHDVLSEEDFFERINRCAGELTEKYSDEEVVFRINVSAETDQFVQLDTDKEHRLYIRNEDDVYILYGEVNSEIWQDFLEGWLFASGLEWDGVMVMEAEGTISDTYTGEKREGMRSMFQYGEDCMRVYGNVVLFHRQEDEVYFKNVFKNGDEEEVFLHPTDIRLEYDGWEDAVSYFKERYPDMYCLEANLYGENTLQDAQMSTHDQIFYTVEEPEGGHGFFHWNGETYEVLSLEKTRYYSMVGILRNSVGYDYDACFLWEKEEDGNVICKDKLEEKYLYIKDLGEGKVIRFQAEIIEKKEDGFQEIAIYKVEVFDEKENEFLQEIQVDALYPFDSPFSFEDFNLDGYLDLIVEYARGHNVIHRHYIFSPSKGKFVKLDSELDCHGWYSVDYETRRTYMHYHESAIDGSEITYQWKDEMDYEIVKQFDHDCQEDYVQVKITRYENGKEESFSDYFYPEEEYAERGDIWGTYYEDFTWEKEVTDKSTGKKYMIRYAEVFLPEEAEKNNGTYYDGRIYVYDEDTYLVSVTHSEIVSESERIEWEDGSEDREQALVIHYADGGESAFYLSGLVQPDYQPAE